MPASSGSRQVLAAHHIPNLITIARLMLVGPVVWLVLQGDYALALLLFLVAGVSDALDGFLAKRYGWTSRLGGILDPMADKLLVLGCFLSLGWAGVLPWWLVGLVLLRDLVIVSGALTYHFLVSPFQAAPTLASKLNTLTQLGLVFLVLLARAQPLLPSEVIEIMIWLTVATTLASGIDYVWTWTRRALRHGKPA